MGAAITSFGIGFVVVCAVFGGAMLGMLIGRRLPMHHTSGETRAVVSVSMAVLGTMSALVIGFLISNASASLAARNGAIAHQSTDIIWLDRLLRRYGPEAEPARLALRHYAASRIADLAPGGVDTTPGVENATAIEALEELQDLLLSLHPQDDRQRWLGTRTLEIAADMGQTGRLVSEQNVSVIPLPFLFLLVFWLAVLFASFGLFAPRNATAVVVLFVGAFAVAAAVKVMLDMDTPFGGHVRMSGFPIRISSQPLQHAQEVIAR
jgi:hypothetical protein